MSAAPVPPSTRTRLAHPALPRRRWVAAAITAALGAAIAAAPAGASVVSVSPDPIEFDVAPGARVATTVTIRNSGNDAIERLSFEVSGAAFTVANVSCPATLQPGLSCDVRVGYRAPAGGKATGTLLVRAGSGIAARVDISAYRPGARPVPGCTVPRLAGLTLPVAKARLKAAGCNLGKVTRPPGPVPRGSRLVVRSSTPKAGSHRDECEVVNLTLARVRAKAPRAALRQEETVPTVPPAWRVFPTALSFATEVGGEDRKTFRVFNDGPGTLSGIYTELDPQNNRFLRQSARAAARSAA